MSTSNTFEEIDEEALLKSDEDDDMARPQSAEPQELNDDDDSLLNDTARGTGEDKVINISDDSDSDDDESNQLEKEYKDIVTELETNIYVYDKYVRLCELSHEIGELDLIRNAYTKFAGAFPMAPQFWLKYINIELSLAQSEDEIKHVDILFQKALSDYFSIDVAMEYAAFAASTAQPEKLWEEIMGTYALHCLKGQEIFKQYRQYVANQVNLSAEEKQKLYTKSYLFELKYPLMNMEDSYVEFKVFCEKNKSSSPLEVDDWSRINDLYFMAKEQLLRMLPFELQLETLDQKCYRERADVYRQYINAMDESFDGNLVQTIYERMVSDCCLNVDCWLDYINFLEDRDTYERPLEIFDYPVYLQNAVDITQRALRNCSWSEQLYIKMMQLLENEKKSREEIQEVLESSMTAGFQTAEPAVAIWTEYLTYLRRHTDWNNDDECDVVRKNFNLAWTILGNQWGVLADCNCEILKFWGRLEYGPLNDPQRGKELWSTVMESSDNATKSGLWIEFTQMEMRRDLEATRKLYRKALHSQGLDNPFVICTAWERFERCNGSMKAVNNCIKETRQFLLNYQQQQQQQQHHHQKKEDTANKAPKRKATTTREGGSPQKKSRPTFQEELPKKTDTRGKKDNKHEQTKHESQFKEHENQEIDLTKDHLRIFLSNLDYNLTEDDIREGLPEININGVNLIRSGNGRSRGFGYLELETENDVEKALSMDRRSLKGRPVFISSVLRDKEKRQKFKYSDGVEPKKLFVKGLPPDATKDEVELIFSPFGPMTDVRLVQHKSGKFKGIAYVEFAEESSASKAVMAADGLDVRGHNIAVAISAPPPKPSASATPGNPLKMLGMAPKRTKVFDQKPRMSLIPNVVRQKLTTKPGAASSSSKNQTNGAAAPSKTNEEFRKLLQKK